MKQHRFSKVTTKNRGRTLVLERMFTASKEQLFHAFSNKEALSAWWGPIGWELSFCKLEFQEEGQWHYSIKCVDESKEYAGQESWGKAIYRKIEDNTVIVYTDYVSNEAGDLLNEAAATVVTLKLVEEKGRTKLVHEAEFVSKSALQKVVNMGVLTGMNETWDKLYAYLKGN